MRIQAKFGLNVRAEKNSKGIALVGVLWLLLLLTTVVLSLSRETQLAAKTAQIYVHEVQARAKIEGAVNESIFCLLSGSSFARLQTELKSTGVDVELYELENQLNINTGTLAQFETVLSDNGIPNARQLAENILDFRDNQKKPGDAKNRNFAHLLDLAQVRGMSIETIRSVKKGLTVVKHSINGRVVSLTFATNNGSIRVHADVVVRFTDSKTDPYRILSWHWTTG